MKLKEFIYTLKVCGIRWFAWLMPLPIIIVFMQQFGSQEKFNDKYVNAVRLGNSGLFFIYSQEIQDKIRDRRKKSNELDEAKRKAKIKEDYEKEFT